MWLSMPTIFPFRENHGANDNRVRPMVVLMQYIEERSPHIVVLENVANFSTKHAAVFRRMLRYFDDLGQYHVFHRVLNTVDYGVPHHRERLYLVLIKKRLLRLQFEWPQVTTPCPPLSKFWDRDSRGVIKKAKTIDPQLLRSTTSGDNLVRAFKQIKKHHGKPKSVDAVIDIGCSHRFSTYKVGAAPTLTAGRCASLGYFSTSLQRKLSVQELMRLQGANPRTLKTEGASRTTLGHMAGNAMSVNVVAKVLEQALLSTDLPIRSQWTERRLCFPAVSAG